MGAVTGPERGLAPWAEAAYRRMDAEVMATLGEGEPEDGQTAQRRAAFVRARERAQAPEGGGGAGGGGSGQGDPAPGRQGTGE